MLPRDELPAPPASPLRLLTGVKVLDLTTSVAAPYATMLLGDLGAEIVKVERPRTGDDSRAWGPPFLEGESLWNLSVNRNKASVTLDYSSVEGLAILERLVKYADVVVVNLVPRVQKKLRVDYERLRSIRPDIVYVSLTGFGLHGTNADKPAYDLIAEGISGVMDITGEADSPPQKIGTPAADLLAGMDAVIGTLAALYGRAGSGAGHLVDVAMVDSMTRFLTPRIVPYLGSGELPKRTGARDSVIAVYQAFATADEPITLGLGNDGLWRRFWEAVGAPETASDARYGTNADRHALRSEITEQIQAILLTMPRRHWLDLFEHAKIPSGPINRIDEVTRDPALHARGLFYNLERDGLNIPQVGLGIQFDGQAVAPRSPPPKLGEHNDVILTQWAGCTDIEIDRLRNSGVI